MKRPKLLIFDLDGTLIDSRQDLVACVNATLLHFNLPTLAESRIAAFIGDGAAALVDRSLQAAAGNASFRHDEALGYFLAHYRDHLLDHTTVYPGVLSALQALSITRFPPHMAVLTNKPVNPSRRICDALHLSRFFFANYGGNSLPTKKPDPAGIQTLRHEAEALRQEPIDPGEVIMIGDSHIDVRTARNAGAVACGCTWGFDPDNLLAASPDLLARTPEDWLTLLQDS